MATDYISRDSLIKQLGELPCKRLIPVTTLCSFIKHFPSADVVEQKHGKWIVSAYELPVGTHCDNCGWAWVDHIHAVKLNPIFSHIKTNYCPNCGASMRKQGETE